MNEVSVVVQKIREYLDYFEEYCRHGGKMNPNTGEIKRISPTKGNLKEIKNGDRKQLTKGKRL